MAKPNITINMGAAEWTVKINDTGQAFNLKSMKERDRHEFIKQFVRAFREQRVAA